MPETDKRDNMARKKLRNEKLHRRTRTTKISDTIARMKWRLIRNVFRINTMICTTALTWHHKSERLIGLKQHRGGLMDKKDYNWAGVVGRQQEWQPKIDTSRDGVSGYLILHKKITNWSISF